MERAKIEVLSSVNYIIDSAYRIRRSPSLRQVWASRCRYWTIMLSRTITRLH
jgi:hypothetical protein